MVYRVVYQPVQIGEAEACYEGEQGRNRGSSCGSSASSSPGIRAGITASVSDAGASELASNVEDCPHVVANHSKIH